LRGAANYVAAVVSTDPIAARLNETFAIFKPTLSPPAGCNKLFRITRFVSFGNCGRRHDVVVVAVEFNA